MARNGDKTHCAQGHPYDETNTYPRANGHRGCRACRAIRGDSPAADRLPVDPLASILADSGGRCAEALGVTRRTWCRWLKWGVPRLQADRVAVRLGRHPSELWADWA